jgi:aerobic C4-dicarboxylate transport protein
MDDSLIPRARKTPWYRQLYTWVLLGIALGVLVGWRWPGFAASLGPLGQMFINALKMVIGPVVFLTIVRGIAGVDSLRKVGRVGVKALVYFQIATLASLLLGMLAGNLFQPGVGVHADPSKIHVSDSAGKLIQSGEHQSVWGVVTDIVPASMLRPFAEGNMLQIVFIAILVGIAINAIGPVGKPIADGLDKLSAVVFKVLNYVMYAAPVGAFGAMAYSIGTFGLDTLTGLGKLVAVFYGTAAVFVFVVLGAVASYLRINVVRLYGYFREEFLVVLGTSSSDTVLPRIIHKLEMLGVPKDIVGLTVPTGYAFNMDGIALYLSLATIYIAQATDANLSIGMQLALIGVMLLTSKGSTGVTGAGFVILAASLSVLGTLPAAGIMLVFAVDKFMSECRALTNVCGNIVATMVVARWEGRLDAAAIRQALRQRPEPSAVIERTAEPAAERTAEPVSSEMA